MMFASFRNPDEVLPVGVPRLLLSESDFHDPDRNDGGEWWQVQPVYALRQGPDAKKRAVHFEVFTKMLGSICSCAGMKGALEVSSREADPFPHMHRSISISTDFIHSIFTNASL